MPPVPAEIAALTEVPLPWLRNLALAAEKAHSARVRKLAWERPGDGDKSKHHGNFGSIPAPTR